MPYKTPAQRPPLFFALTAIILFLTIIFNFTAQAQNRVPLHSPFELRLSTTRQHGNPYLDVNVTGVFTSPSGKQMRLAGFWDGGPVWRVRFTPVEAGVWTYHTQSNDAELQTSGQFEATASNRRGFVRVSKTRPYGFEYGDGTPFLLMGDTIWDGMSDGVGLNPHFKEYVNLRTSQGFNAYHTIVVHNRYDYGSNEGGATFEPSLYGGRDYDRVNPKFFQWVDRRVAYADSMGMVSILFFTWAAEARNMTPDQYQRVSLYIVSRCAAYNAFWVLVGDYQAYFYEPAIYRRLGAAVADADPFDHPISIHPADSYVNREFAREPWLSYIMHQIRDAGEFLADSVRFDRIYNKPVVNGEYGYHVPESVHPFHGLRNDAHYLRTGGWSIFGAGGYFVAGFGRTFYDPDGHYGYDEGFDHPPVSWDLNFAPDLEMARQYKVFYKFFTEQTSWPELQPHRDLVRDGQTELLAKAGAEYIAYNARGGRMRLQLPAGHFSLAWFDPIAGTLQPSRIFASTGETVLIMPSDSLDAAAAVRPAAAPSLINAGRVRNLTREQLNIRQVRYRWQTPDLADSRLTLLKPDGSRIQFVDTKTVKEHAVVVDGLSPEIDYHVTVFSQSEDRREWKTIANTLRTKVVVMDEWREAENFPTRTAGHRESPGWNLDENGHLATTLDFPQAGPYRFTIRARGECRHSIWPRLSFLIDDRELAARDINSAIYKDFIFEREMTAGSHRLKLAFTNGGDSRQLIVDRVHVQFVRAITPEPEPDTDTETPSPPTSLRLQEYPNPFRDLILFKAALPAGGRISLKIFDLQGREIVPIIDEERSTGELDLIWDGKDREGLPVAAGIYFAVLTLQTETDGLWQNQRHTQKLLRLK
jgi:hypothetical protein